MTSQRTKPHVRRWTGYVAWAGDPATTEEIDVDAETLFEATAKVEQELAANYRAGGKIVRVVVRFGFYV